MPDDDQSMSLWLTSVETIDAATERVAWTHSHIEKHHGPEATREIFLTFCKRLSNTRLYEHKKRDLLWMYDQMQEPNVAALAREVVEKNAERSKENQLTPRFRPSITTVDKYLRNLLEEREEAQRAGIWEGAASLAKRGRRGRKQTSEQWRTGSFANETSWKF